MIDVIVAIATVEKAVKVLESKVNLCTQFMKNLDKALIALIRRVEDLEKYVTKRG